MKDNARIKKSITDFRSILESVPDLYLIIDTHFMVIDASEMYLTAAKTTRADLLGRSIFEIFPDNPAYKVITVEKNLRTSFENVIKNKTTDTMSVQRYYVFGSQTANGAMEERYWSPINAPVLGEDGNVKYIIHRVNDVTDFVNLKKNDTEQQRAAHLLRTRTGEMEIEIYLRAQEIQEANKQLMEANKQLAQKEQQQKILNNKLEKFNQSKTQFFANVSHELRTPLTLILGILETLLADHNLISQQYNLKVIERNARHLLELVNDLLDIAKLEAGKVPINYVAMDLAKLVRQTAGLFETYASERHVKYYINTPSILRAEIDPEKIQRVLLNLLSNAFKFTPASGTVHCVLSTRNVHTAQIVIIDSGPGIPQKMRESIFERFFYVESSENRQFSGVSLGLAMVKDFIELQGGSVRLEDAPEGGAVFTIELPVLAPPNAIVHKEHEAGHLYNKETAPSFIHKLSSPKTSVVESLKVDTHLPLVLIVEDNIDVNQYIAGVLSSSYRTESAYDGEEGLEKAIALHPDIILSDIMMPRLDGIQLIRKIREHKNMSDLPIIIISAKIDEELCAKLLSAGAQDYLAKPFSHAELKARVANLINLKKAQDELSSKNVELTAANKELDAFGYSVSHDLRNPLQAIIGFSSILLDDYKFDVEVIDYLSHILVASKRMEELINDLLQLSHALRNEIKTEMVNLSEMVRDILKTFAIQEPTREVAIVIQNDVMARCDSHMVRIALENLLSNAWKYTTKTPDARIEFGTMAAPVPIYYIRDNGIGFPQEKADRLFLPFARLHSERDFPGTGIGLAIVRRIVERHEGRISVESVVGQGTTFYMTLAKEKAKIV